jgi:cation:H+ antiporter
MLFNVLAIAFGCVGLYFGGDLLLKGATAIGAKLGWSAAVIGFVLVSLGTSAPELFVSAGAAVQGYGDMAAGNVVGSNIVNIAIVLGLGALILPLPIDRAIRVHQLPLMIVMTAVGFFFLIDGHVGRIEGLILLVAALLSVWWAMRVDGPPADLEESLGTDLVSAKKQSWTKSGVYVLAGIVLLIIGAEGLIFGGVGLAKSFGVPDAVIALTITSIGTGLPEITATVLAVARRDTALAIGNVVGSNLLNIGLVLGVSGLIAPIDSSGVDSVPLMTMFLLTALLAVLAWFPGYIARVVGGALLASFGVYTLLLLK